MGAGSSMVMAFVLHKVGMVGMTGWPTSVSALWRGMVWCLWCLWAFLARWLSWFDEKLDRGWYFLLGTLPRKMVNKLSPSPTLKSSFPLKICRLTLSTPQPIGWPVVGRPWCPYVFLSPWRWRPWQPPFGPAWPPLRRRVRRVLRPSPSGHEERPCGDCRVKIFQQQKNWGRCLITSCETQQHLFGGLKGMRLANDII